MGDGVAPAGCEHGEVEDNPQRPWLEPDSPPHIRLREVMLSTRFTNSLDYYVNFRYFKIIWCVYSISMISDIFYVSLQNLYHKSISLIARMNSKLGKIQTETRSWQPKYYQPLFLYYE